MRKRAAVSDITQMRTGRVADAQKRYGLGTSMLRKLAKESGAEIKIGAVSLIDFVKLDKYLGLE